MKILRYKKAIIGGCFAFILIIAVGSILLYKQQHSQAYPLLDKYGKINMIGEEKKWEARIKSEGSEAAYDEFGEYAHVEDTPTMHTIAHAFGAALYQTEGFSAVGICGELYSYGCLHEMFKRAIEEFGTGAFVQLADTCQTAIGKVHPCEHAMGHGLLTSFGYTHEGLLKTIQDCNSKYTDDLMNGCLGGMFMEYNLYSVLSLPIDAREKENNSWYEPCDELPHAAVESCYYWLPQWWVSYLPTHWAELAGLPKVNTSIFIKAGELCNPVTNLLYKRDCFESLGQIIANSGFSHKAALTLCNEAATSTTANLLCRAYAGYMFTHIEPKTPNAGLPLCEGFTGDKETFCETYAKGEVYIPHDIPLPASVPAQF